MSHLWYNLFILLCKCLSLYTILLEWSNLNCWEVRINDHNAFCTLSWRDCISKTLLWVQKHLILSRFYQKIVHLRVDKIKVKNLCKWGQVPLIIGFLWRTFHNQNWESISKIADQKKSKQKLTFLTLNPVTDLCRKKFYPHQLSTFFPPVDILLLYFCTIQND